MKVVSEAMYPTLIVLDCLAAQDVSLLNIVTGSGVR